MVLVVCLTGFRRREAGAMATTMEPGGGQDHDDAALGLGAHDNPPSHLVLTPEEPHPTS
jgi:hypothetical protein